MRTHLAGLSLALLATVLGCDDAPRRPPVGDAGDDGAGDAVPLVEVVGSVEDLADGTPKAGTAVSVLGAEESYTTETDVDGAFRLLVPANEIHELMANLPFYWGSIVAVSVGAENTAGVAIKLIHRDLLESLTDFVQLELDNAKGVAWVTFDTPNTFGGESAVLSEDSDPPFTWFPPFAARATDALVAGAEPVLVFPSVDGTSMSLAPSGSRDLSDCVLALPALVSSAVRAGFVTWIDVTCTALEPPAGATVTGTVLDADTGNPIEGAVIAVHDPLSAATTTTSALGEFTIAVPFGTRMLSARVGGYWGVLRAAAIPAEGLSGLRFELPDDGSYEDILVALGRTVDPSLGEVRVVFEGRSIVGGETAALDTAAEVPFTADEDTGWPIPQAKLVVNGTNELHFSHASVGTTRVAVQGAEGVDSCSLDHPEIDSWVVLDKTISVVTATCSPIAPSVSGRVTDSVTGNPLADATVALVGSSPPVHTTTGSDGAYVLDSAPTGSFVLRAQATGYWGRAKAITLAEGPLTDVDFELLSDGAVAAIEAQTGTSWPPSLGVVWFRLDAPGGLGGERGRVGEDESNASWTYDAAGVAVESRVLVPGGSGDHVFPNNIPDNYPLYAFGSTWTTVCELIDHGLSVWPVEPKVILEAEVACKPAPDRHPSAVVTGTVTNADDGSPLEDARVQTTDPSITVYTDAAGHFSIALPTVGTLLTVRKEFYWGEYRPLVVEEGLDLDIRLLPNTTVAGWGRGAALGTGILRVAFETDSSVGGESATAARSAVSLGTPFTFTGSGTLTESATVLANGERSLYWDDISVGSASVTISGADGITECSRTAPLVGIFVNTNVVTNVIATCTTVGAIVSGVLSDESGTPVAGAEVSLLSDPTMTDTTDGAGAFSLVAPLGTEFIVVNKTGYWSSYAPVEVVAGGVSDATAELVSDAAIAAREASVTAGVGSFDVAQALVAVSYADSAATGGETASASAASGWLFTQDGAGDWIPATALLEGGTPELWFGDVAVGSDTTTLSVSGGTGGKVCVLDHDVTDWPVAARTITWATATCR